MSKLKLQSSDGEIFEVDIQVVNHSSLIKGLLENKNGTDDNNDDPILLPKCSSPVLQKIIEYCTYHKDDEKEDEEECLERSADDICAWDQEFIKVNDRLVYDLLLASHYLDMKKLLNACGSHIANMIKGCTPAEIRAIFNERRSINQMNGATTNNDTPL